MKAAMTPEKLKSSLRDLARMDAESRGREAVIRKAAGHRRGEIERRLAALRPKVYTDKAAAREYLDLVTERGEIDRMGAP